MKRKTFLHTALAGLTGLGISPPLAATAQRHPADPLSTALVKEFVAAGHNDLARVKELLTEQPNLLYARYDWGSGDFEGAIEGAGHVGNRAIAEYLIEQGARVNLFVLTMLGQTALVQPVLETYPDLIQARGPHGFTLLHHAKVGGEPARALYEYLEEKGLKILKMNE